MKNILKQDQDEKKRKKMRIYLQEGKRETLIRGGGGIIKRGRKSFN